MFKSLALAIVLAASVAHAEDYYSKFKAIYDDAMASSHDPVAYKADFQPGAFSHCAYAENFGAKTFTPAILGICTYTSPDAGPAVPAQSFESICWLPEAQNPQAGYGFTLANQAGIDGQTVYADARVQPDLVQIRDVRTQEALMGFRKVNGMLAFKSYNERMYGYCWK